MKYFLISTVLLVSSTFAFGQFNSGSTGADGVLDTSTMTCPSNLCRLQIPESGVFNFTSVNVGKSLVFYRNSRNTPVIILAQGNVTISDHINVSQPREYDNTFGFNEPGPGGFYGGALGMNGFGSGGGIVGTGTGEGGKWIGNLSLNPIVGGSGGANTGCGGGGAIIIASSTSISMNGQAAIKANSIFGGAFCTPNGGSGGAIRLVANSIQILGGTFLQATGANNGVIRIEANNLLFNGTSNPLATSAPINPIIVSGNPPRLTISSIGGFSVPSYSGSRFDLIDLLLPNQLPDPINVVVSANNIPTGTEVQVGFVSGSPSGTSAPCNLAGTFASSSCTATISNLNRTGGTYLLATAAFSPPASLAKYNPKGKSQVAKIRLETALGNKTNFVFLRNDGSKIDPENIKPQFLKEFGM